MLGLTSFVCSSGHATRTSTVHRHQRCYFSSLPHENNPPLDDFLGDFKDKWGEDNFITEFVSMGPKNYGYLTKKEKECKVRGISLNSEGSKQLNYQVLRQNVLDEIQRPLKKTRQTGIYKPYRIVRNSKEYSLTTISQTKKYQLVYEKQVIDPHTFKTYPYGYERITNEDVDMIELLCHL